MERPQAFGGTMSDVPLDICIAGYRDPASAKADFDALKKAQLEGIVLIDGVTLVSCGVDGTMQVKESGDHDVFKGTTLGVANSQGAQIVSRGGQEAGVVSGRSGDTVGTDD
jgi:hypothetical protein